MFWLAVYWGDGVLSGGEKGEEHGEAGADGDDFKCGEVLLAHGFDKSCGYCKEERCCGDAEHSRVPYCAVLWLSLCGERGKRVRVSESKRASVLALVFLVKRKCDTVLPNSTSNSWTPVK